jgi:hypothetical protein
VLRERLRSYHCLLAQVLEFLGDSPPRSRGVAVEVYALQRRKLGHQT